MTLSWKSESFARPSSLCFFTENGEINMLFFYFENVSVGGKKDSEQVFGLLAHVKGAMF